MKGEVFIGNHKTEIVEAFRKCKFWVTEDGECTSAQPVLESGIDGRAQCPCETVQTALQLPGEVVTKAQVISGGYSSNNISFYFRELQRKILFWDVFQNKKNIIYRLPVI